MEWIVSHYDLKHLHQRLLLQYSNFMSLSDRESVIVNAVIPVLALGKHGEITTASVQTRLAYSLALGTA